jgi:hypothetical protein
VIVEAGHSHTFFDKRDWRKPLSIDPEVKHVKTIVVPHHIVKLLWLDALRDVDLLIK